MFLWRRVAPQSPEDGLKPTAAPGYARNFRDLNRMISQGKSFSGYERNACFLNLGGSGFADVAGLLGVDFDDDARAVAVVDWDRDGDQDLLVTNRTAPRVRLLRNHQPSAHSFVEIRLIGNGTTTNRDAVGARITLWPASRPGLKQIRTIHAGDSFLSQSSPWAHFGLGESVDDLQVSIAWPGGGTQTLSNLKANARHTIAQDQGRLDLPSPPAPPAITGPAGPDPPEAGGTTGFWVANRVPFPQLTYTDSTGAPRSTTDLLGKPVLVNLWATWCAPCLKELGAFGAHAGDLRARSATILALNVDGISAGGGAAPGGDVAATLAQVGYNLPHGAAPHDALAKLEVVIEFLSSRRGPLSIPSSFLVDAEGNVAAVYLEALVWDQLDRDLSMLNAPPASQLARLSPRAGKWFADPRQVDRAASMGDYATLFATNGFHEESRRLYQMVEPRDGVRGARAFYNRAKSAAQQGLTEQAMEHYRDALRLDPGYGEALTGLGALLLMQKRVEEAQPLFEKALSIDPNHATALINLAMIDQRRGDTASALDRLHKVIARNPDYAEAHLNLGSLLASLKRHDEAIQHLVKAVELNPKWAAAHLNLAAAYVETRQWDKAEDHYRRVLSLNPRLGYPHAGLGNLQALQAKHAEAVASYRTAISLGNANAQTYTRLAQSLLSLGEKQPAFEALHKALELDPKHAPANQALRENGFPTD